MPGKDETMLRNKRILAIIAVVAIIPVAGIAWWLLSPLFMDTTVDEEFPFASNAPVSSSQPSASSETMSKESDAMSSNAMMDKPDSGDAMMDKETDAMTSETTIMDEKTDVMMSDDKDSMSETAMMDKESEAMTDEAMMDKTEDSMAMAKDEAMTSEEEDSMGMMESGPVVLAMGSFRDADSFHKGSGTASIYQGPDGSRVLRFEDFSVTNGPDLHVFLTSASDAQSSDDVMSPGGYIDLGELKGNVGNQNYTIPDDFDIPENGSVVIYCVPFHVIFSVAPLQDQG
jgi:hypothetical protein